MVKSVGARCWQAMRSGETPEAGEELEPQITQTCRDGVPAQAGESGFQVLTCRAEVGRRRIGRHKIQPRNTLTTRTVGRSQRHPRPIGLGEGLGVRASACRRANREIRQLRERWGETPGEPGLHTSSFSILPSPFTLPASAKNKTTRILQKHFA